MAERAERPTGKITDEGVARLRARIGVPEPHPHAAALPLPERSTRSATSPRRTATTTRSGAIPSTAPTTPLGRPDRVAARSSAATR